MLIEDFPFYNKMPDDYADSPMSVNSFLKFINQELLLS